MSDNAILTSIEELREGQKAIVSCLLKLSKNIDENQEQKHDHATVHDAQKNNSLASFIQSIENASAAYCTELVRFSDVVLFEMRDMYEYRKYHEYGLAMEAIKSLWFNKIESLSRSLYDFNDFLQLVKIINAMQKDKNEDAESQ